MIFCKLPPPHLFSPAKAPWQILAYPHPSQDSDLKSHGIQPRVSLDSEALEFHLWLSNIMPRGKNRKVYPSHALIDGGWAQQT